MYLIPLFYFYLLTLEMINKKMTSNQFSFFWNLSFGQLALGGKLGEINLILKQ